MLYLFMKYETPFLVRLKGTLDIIPLRGLQVG